MIRKAFSAVLLTAGLFNASYVFAQTTTATKVDNGVPDCPAFDIVQRNILDITGGSVGTQQASATSTAPVAVEIIFDASGSMGAKLQGRKKFDIALNALRTALSRLDGSDALVGIRAYGFDDSVEKTPEASCPNTALVSGFRQKAAGAHFAASASLRPYGYTPIAASLEAAGRDLQGVAASDRMVVLVSDGEETCNGDPVAVAAALKAANIAVATYVVGFDLDAAQRDQMTAIAREGGGAYFDAADATGLESAIDQAVGVTLRRTRTIEKCINDIAGGHSVAEAVPVGPGLYTVGEMLPKQTARFYRIDSKQGQHIVVRGLLQSHLTYPGPDGKPFETKYGLGAFTLKAYFPDGRPVPIRAARARNIPGTSFALEYTDASGEGMVISVADNYDWVAPDALFAVEIDGVTGTGTIAQAAPPKAPPATQQGSSAGAAASGRDGLLQGRLDEMVSGEIGGADPVDVWRISLPKPATSQEGWQGVVSIDVRPEVPGVTLQVSVKGERDGQVVELADNRGGSGVLAKAAHEPGRPLDALIITVTATAGAATSPYKLIAYGDG
ncbi:MAG: VWA domain-containing protein [Rhodobiaceae bacterium]|nr:VWA domain-containing protein [Rhodobiaceae bacterium]